MRTIAFPAISCGAYRYPIAEAAGIAIATTTEFLRENNSIEQVTFVVASDDIHEAYQGLF